MVRKKKANSLATCHDEQLDRGKTHLINVVSFLLGFAQAILLYVMSYYFKNAAGTENVGLFYLVSYAISLVIFLNLHKVIKAIGKSNTFLFSMLLKIIILSVLMNILPSLLSVAILVVYIVLVNLEWLSLDIILESFSSDKMSGRIRGKHLTVLNAGFLLGPFVSTRILDKLGFDGLFMVLFLFSAVIFVISLVSLRNVNHKFNGELTARDIVVKIYRRKDILRIYYISFVLEFFYALMVIYTPLYLRDIGVSWDKIGFIFTFMLVPFVILQYPMGILADKKFGEKEFIIFSIVIMCVATLAVYFTASASVAVWAVILFATRIGAALIEILRDSYFFKRIDGHDVDIINFFRTAQSMGYIIGALISTLLLIFFPMKAVFFAIAIVIISALYPAMRLEDNKCEDELNLGRKPALKLGKSRA